MILKDPATFVDVITGVEVARDGDVISGSDFDERVHIIALALITKRVAMTMDFHYGTLIADRRVDHRETT